MCLHTHSGHELLENKQMVKVIWVDEKGEHEEFFTEVASACCHFIWKRWPYARINLAKGTILGQGDVVVARIVYDE